jgi:glycosyltransferase involved in cell wall biosynthesis
MTPPLVSCIIPVFNGERYLSEALHSVLTQTHRPVEVIVVDDGSTDGTRAIANGFAGHVTYVYQANAGHGAARNAGIALATGEFVAFLDADDLWHTDKLAHQLDCFRERPSLDGCVTLVRNFWSAEVPIEQRVPDDARVSAPVPGFRSVTLLARRIVFGLVGPFNPLLRHGNDTDWFMRAAEHGAVFAMLPEVLVERRLHGANRSRQLGAASQREYLRIIKASLDRRRTEDSRPPRPYVFQTTEDR